MQIHRTHKWWKERGMAENYARLKSPVLLRAHIEHKGISLTKLAQQATFFLISEYGPGRKVSRQMISLLVHADGLDPDGRPRGLSSCSPELAAAIETALDVPTHMLFDVLPKPSQKRETAKADAA